MRNDHCKLVTRDTPGGVIGLRFSVVSTFTSAFFFFVRFSAVRRQFSR